jgi:hypothetical protein
VNVAFNDAAANTVSVPPDAGTAEPAALDEAEAEPDALTDDDTDAEAAADVVALVVPELLLDPHAASTVSPAAASTAIAPRMMRRDGERLTNALQGFRR